MKQLLTLRDQLDHEIRNGVLGVVLELRTLARSLSRLQGHLDRIDTACSTCLAQMDTHSEFSNIEKKEEPK